MNKENYVLKRNELIAKAQTLLEAQSIEECQNVQAEIKMLDTNFENACKEAANITALKDLKIARGANVEVENFEINPQSESKLYEDVFAKFLMNVELNADEQACFDKFNVKNAAGMQTKEEHTILVPETVREQIWQEIGESHPILNSLAITYINSDLSIIKETVEGADAEFYDEKTQGKQDEIGFGKLTLGACELFKCINVSWSLKKQAITAFMAYITNKLAEKMGNALAKAVVSGKGKPTESDSFKAQPRGILTALNAESGKPQIVSCTSAITYDNIVDLMALVKSGYLTGAEVYAKNTDIWSKLAKIKDTTGQPIFVPSVTTDKAVGRLFGVPVREEDAVPAGTILVANVNLGYAINVKEDVSFSMEDHVRDRNTDYIAYSLVDGDVLTTKAFAALVVSGE